MPKSATKRNTTVKTRGRAVEPAPACYCYIVQCADGTFYTGWAVDAERRLKVHNAGRGARYTSSRRPVKLVYVEPQPDRNTAMRRERAIKKLTRERKRALIQGPLQAAAPTPSPRRAGRRPAPEDAQAVPGK
jgi:putative endonuclease